MPTLLLACLATRLGAALLTTAGGDLALELNPEGRVVALTVAQRPVTVVGLGGWEVTDLRAGVDRTLVCPLPARPDEGPEQGRPFDLLALLNPPDGAPPAPAWMLGEGWQPAAERHPLPPGVPGPVVRVAVPPGGTSSALRLFVPTPEARAGAAYTVRVFVRRDGLQGRVRVGALPLSAAGRAAGAWYPLAPTPDDALREPWSLWTAHVLPPPSTAGLALWLAAEEAQGGLACGGASVTVHPCGEQAAFEGVLREEGDAAVFTGQANGLALRAEYRVDGPAVRLKAVLTQEAPADRLVTLSFRLPADGSSWLWWDTPRHAEKVGGDVLTHESWRPLGSQLFSPWPLGCITRPAPAAGLALAAPLSQPVLTRFGYRRGDGLFAACDLAFAPRLGRSRAELALVCFAPDARWGLRSALERYYALFPEDLRGRGLRAGAWFTSCDPEAIGDPRRVGLAFDEQAADHLDWTRRHGLTALRAVQPWGRDAQSPPAPAWRPTDAHGRPLVPHSDGAPALAPWCLAPQLGPDSPAALATSQLTDRLQLGDVALDGALLDGLGARWAGWHLADHHPDHLRATDVPLAVDRAARAPCVPLALLGCEWLRGVSTRLRVSGRVLAGSLDAETPLPQVLAWLDMVGGGERAPSADHLLWLRALAPAKPLTFLEPDLANPAATGETIAEIWRRALLVGAFPGPAGWLTVSQGELAAPWFAAYAPVLARLAQAGWQPVPHAEANDSEVLLERFGAGETLCLVVQNNAPRTRTVTLTLWPRALGLRGAPRALGDLLQPGRPALACQTAFDRWQGTVVLEPRQTRVLVVGA
jgi:hypothetical protein